MKSISANIRKLYAINFLRELIFFIPILVPFWSKWFSMKEIFILEASYSAMLLVFEIPSGYFLPVFQDYIQKMVSSDRRATVLSIRSFVTRGIFLLLGPFLGYITDLYTIQTAFLTIAIILAVLSTMSLLGLRRVRIL